MNKGVHNENKWNILIVLALLATLVGATTSTAQANGSPEILWIRVVDSTTWVLAKPSAVGQEIQATSAFWSWPPDYGATCTVDYGDGSGPQSGDAWPWDEPDCIGPAHTYAAAGMYNVVIEVTFSNGQSVSRTLDHVVEGVGDTTLPTITLNTPPVGAVYMLGQTVNVDYACQDEAGGLGLASCVGNVSNRSPIDTGSIGAKTFTVTATDNAGNTATTSTSYSVIYNFTGFSSPVDNNGILNIAKAGQTIPLKWCITDANGVPVTNLTSVTVTAVSLSCSVGTTTDLIEEYAPGTSGLQNLGDGYYQWNWKAPTAYVNSRKMLRLDLGEGAGFEHTALFQFRK